MLQSGDFVVPRLLGEPYLDKPPLLYWATAGSFQLFGPSEFAARFPTALAAMLTILATFALGTRLLGPRAAFLGSLMLLLSLGFVLSGRFVIMDGPLTLFTTVCLMALFLAVRGPRVRLAWWLVAAVACSLGILTKGPVAIVLTIPPLLVLLWLDRTQARIRPQHWFVFALVVLAVTAPWFILIGQRQGEFASYFLWKHHVLRFVSAFNHKAPMWYYLPVLLIGMFPSSLLLGPTLDFLAGRRAELCRAQNPGTRSAGARRCMDRGIFLGVQLQAADVYSASRPAVVSGTGLYAPPVAGRQVHQRGLGPSRSPVARARHGSGGGHRRGHCRR